MNMIELVVYDFDEVSDLEWELILANIEYQICIDMGHYGIRPPHIVVNGVPLDEKRAMIWIKEHDANG